jgi:hypothetical protein
MKEKIYFDKGGVDCELRTRGEGEGKGEGAANGRGNSRLRVKRWSAGNLVSLAGPLSGPKVCEQMWTDTVTRGCFYWGRMSPKYIDCPKDPVC